MIRIGKRLYVDLNTALLAALLKGRKEICDVIPRVPVETGAKSLLVEVVGNETHATAQYEETVENTHLHVVLRLLGGEGAAVAHEIHKADSNAAIDVENQIVLLRCCDGLHRNSVVEQLGAGEIFLHVVLDKLDTEIRVVAGLDTVTDTRN